MVKNFRDKLGELNHHLFASKTCLFELVQVDIDKFTNIEFLLPKILDENFARSNCRQLHRLFTYFTQSMVDYCLNYNLYLPFLMVIKNKLDKTNYMLQQPFEIKKLSETTTEYILKDVRYRPVS